VRTEVCRRGSLGAKASAWCYCFPPEGLPASSRSSAVAGSGAGAGAGAQIQAPPPLWLTKSQSLSESAVCPAHQHVNWDRLCAAYGLLCNHERSESCTERDGFRGWQDPTAGATHRRSAVLRGFDLIGRGREPDEGAPLCDPGGCLTGNSVLRPGVRDFRGSRWRRLGHPKSIRDWRGYIPRDLVF
jgi:hypothetical protein